MRPSATPDASIASQTGIHDVARWRMFAYLAACATVLVVYVYLSTLFQNDVMDDPWIGFRYARNLARGLGFRWNPGERPVEGYTNFLWVVINALGIRFQISPLIWSHACSLVAGIVSLAVAMSPWNIMVKTRMWRLFLGLVMGTCPIALFMAQSGMETQLSVTLVFLAVITWAYAETRYSISGYLIASITFTLACMTRPENSIFLISLVFCTWWNCRLRLMPQSAGKRRYFPLIPLIAPISIVGIPYIIWRIYYFGYLLPNSYYAKYSGHGLGNLIYGLTYTGETMAYYLSAPITVVAITLQMQTGVRGRLRAEISCVCVMFMLYITYAGGDDISTFPVGRLLIPVIVLFSWLTISTMEELLANPRLMSMLLSMAVLAALIFIPEAPESYRLISIANRNLDHNSSITQALGLTVINKLRNPDERRSSPVSEWVLSHTQPGDYISYGAAGRVPYYTDRPTIDSIGLNDVHIAHLKPEGQGIGGKTDPEYLIARHPKLIMVPVVQDCTGNTLSAECVWTDGDKRLLSLLGNNSEYRLEPDVVPYGEKLQKHMAGGIVRIFVRQD